MREFEIEPGARRLQPARVRLEGRRREPRAVNAPPKTRAATVIGRIVAATASMTITTITGTTEPSSSSIKTETNTTG